MVSPPHSSAQNIPGVPKLEEGLNPATWMLQISTAGMEANLGTDFNEQYRNSRLYQCVHLSCLMSDLCVLHVGTAYAQQVQMCLPWSAGMCFLFTCSHPLSCLELP